MNRRLKVRLLLLLLLLFLTAIFVYATFWEENRELLTVAFLNIGQGDAIFIESPGGNQMLIDGGPGRSILRELSKVMPFYDRSIDVVLATHPDADHIGGLPNVFERYKVNTFIYSGLKGNTALYYELEDDVDKEKSKVIEARKGMNIDLGSGVNLQILFPVIDPEGMETNTSSIVARLVYGENEFLLTGDSPSSIESYLVSQQCQRCPLTLESDVLKAGHHGSKTSTSEEFVKVVAPKYAVISAGRDNKYGHPHKEVLDILNNAHIKILRTDLDGRIIFQSDGVNLKLK